MFKLTFSGDKAFVDVNSEAMRDSVRSFVTRAFIGGDPERVVDVLFQYALKEQREIAEKALRNAVENLTQRRNRDVEGS